MNTAARVGLAASLCFLVASFPAIAQKAVPADSIAIGVVNPENGDAVLYTDLSAQDRSLNRIQVTIKNDKATAFAFPDKQCVATISMGNFLSDSELKGATLDDKSASSWKLVVDKGKFSIYAIGDKTLAGGESFIVTFNGVLIKTAEFAGASVTTTVSVQSTFPDKKVYRASVTFTLRKRGEPSIDLRHILSFDASKQIEDHVLQESYIECWDENPYPNKLRLELALAQASPETQQVVLPEGTTVTIELPYYKEGDASVSREEALTTAEYLNKTSIVCSGPFGPPEHQSASPGTWVFRQKAKGDIVFRRGEKIAFLVDNLVSQLPAGSTSHIIATVKDPTRAATTFQIPIEKRWSCPQILKFEVAEADKHPDGVYTYGDEVTLDLELYGDCLWRIKYQDMNAGPAVARKEPVYVLLMDTPYWPATKGSLTLRLPRGSHRFVLESTAKTVLRPGHSPEIKSLAIDRINVKVEEAKMTFEHLSYQMLSYLYESTQPNAPFLLTKPYHGHELLLRTECRAIHLTGLASLVGRSRPSIPGRYKEYSQRQQFMEDQARIEKTMAMTLFNNDMVNVVTESTIRRGKTDALNPLMNISPKVTGGGVHTVKFKLINRGFPKEQPAIESSTLTIYYRPNDPFGARSDEVILDEREVDMVISPPELINLSLNIPILCN